jgi:protocatechuate 3,4-dioxygenase beta subunit
MTDRRALEAGSQPPLLYPPYRSTVRRAPAQPLVQVPERLVDLAAPVYGYLPIDELDNDLTRQHSGEPLGERIVVAGRVLDEDGRPVPHTLVELWQCNAAGRYRHWRDNHPAPIDPNFSGGGRTVTDAQGNYRFLSIKPGAYPWGNHDNAWRPAHIHFSLFGHSNRDAAGHADVFPQRSALRVRPDVPVDSRRACAPSPRIAVRPLADAAGLGIGISLRYRAPRQALDSV